MKSSDVESDGGLRLNVSQQWNRSLMSRERDLRPAGRVTHRYAILSVPRSGSTLLARAIEQTGQRGIPHEYLNPNAMAAWKSWGGDPATSIDEYLREIESRRTSSSGWFGIKVHFRQFRQHFGEDAFARATDFVNSQDLCVLVTRTDHVAQAASYHRARQTGLWTSEHEELARPSAPPMAPFRPESLIECLDEIEDGENQWRRIICAAETPCFPVVFEELISDYGRVMRGVLGFLGLDGNSLPPMPMRKTRVRADDDLVEDFRRHLDGIVPLPGGSRDR